MTTLAPRAARPYRSGPTSSGPQATSCHALTRRQAVAFPRSSHPRPVIADTPAAAPAIAVAQRMFDAHQVRCPRCGELLRRMHIEDGSLYVTCDERQPDPQHPGHSKRCGQHSHILATDGVAIVTAITRAQFDQLAGKVKRPADVYAQLGVIERRTQPR